MSKAERSTEQLRNHSANHAQAVSPSQLRSPGNNDRKDRSHSWPPPWGAMAADYNVALAAVAGPPCSGPSDTSSPYRAVTQPPSLDPMDLSSPGGTAQPQPALAQHAKLSPLERTTSVHQAQLPPSSTFRWQWGSCTRRLTSVKCDWQGTAHRCNKKTYGQSVLAHRVPCARTRNAHEMKEGKRLLGPLLGSSLLSSQYLLGTTQLLLFGQAL